MLTTQMLTFSWPKMNAFKKNPVLQKGTLKIILGTYLFISLFLILKQVTRFKQIFGLFFLKYCVFFKISIFNL